MFDVDVDADADVRIRDDCMYGGWRKRVARKLNG